MLLDILEAAFKALVFTAAGAVMLIGLLFMAAHVHDTWDAPPPLHSGARPECPSWDSYAPDTDF